MKNIIKIIGLGSLICFSFFYTDKVINVVSEQDEIMIKLNQVKDKYKINSIDAKIIDDTIIPGIKGRQIDIDKSYNSITAASSSDINYNTDSNINNTSVGSYYILNKSSKKFHIPTCRSVKQMKESNKMDFYGTRDEAISQGYSPCGNCNP